MTNEACQVSSLSLITGSILESAGKKVSYLGSTITTISGGLLIAPAITAVMDVAIYFFPTREGDVVKFVQDSSYIGVLANIMKVGLCATVWIGGHALNSTGAKVQNLGSCLRNSNCTIFS